MQAGTYEGCGRRYGTARGGARESGEDSSQVAVVVNVSCSGSVVVAYVLVVFFTNSKARMVALFFNGNLIKGALRATGSECYRQKQKVTLSLACSPWKSRHVRRRRRARDSGRRLTSASVAVMGVGAVNECVARHELHFPLPTNWCPVPVL